MNKSGITIAKLRAACERLGYVFFERGNFNLNLIAIRVDDPESNAFNDWLTVSYKDRGRWVLKVYPMTCDPGVFWRENPMNKNGTAILVPGQHRGAFRIGQHRGDYSALVQAKNLPVYRDANEDAVLDFDVPVEVGFQGINLHRAAAMYQSAQVDKWSAGCQVLANPHHFDFLMTLCRQAADQYGAVFSYTLLTQSQFVE